MSPVLLAMSAEEMIETVGSYAGLAAIVGLGVLALLYFAQAREVRRLREWAGRAPERAAELGQRVQADAQRRVVAQPLAPATTAAQQADAARGAAAVGSAKAPPAPPQPAPIVAPPGQLARAVLPAQPGAGTVPPAPSANAAPTAPPGGASAPAAPAAPTATPRTAAGPAAPAPPAAGVPLAPPAAAVPPAATPAAAAARKTAAPSRTVSPLDNGAGGQDTHESAAARPEPMPSPPPRPVPVDERGGFSRARIGAIVAGAVVAILAAAVLTVVLTGGDEQTPPNDFGSTTQPAATPGQQGGSGSGGSAGGAPVDRRATRVAVLNGTTQTGLARAVADEVEKARFTIAGTENNADQAVPTTTVSFRPGNERAAQIVARVLQLDRSLVRPVDANTSAAADADVIVIVGADKIG